MKYNLLHANSFYSRGFTNSSQILCFFFSFSFYTPPEKTTLPLACLVRNRPGLYPSPCICSFSLLASVGGAWPALLGSLLPARPPESASAVAARAAGALPADATCATDVNIWVARSRSWPVERCSLLPALLPPVVDSGSQSLSRGCSALHHVGRRGPRVPKDLAGVARPPV